MRYLSPVALAKLQNLNLELRRISAEGHVGGRHRSSGKGLSREFAQHRAYVPGDEIKSLDWKVCARQDRYYVKEYQSENIFTCTILLDASGSMDFSQNNRPTKWENACSLAMGMAYIVLAGGDAVGLASFDVEPRRMIPCRTSFGQLEVLDSALRELSPGAETDLSRVLEIMAGQVRRRSLVVLISDLMGDSEQIMKVIKAFAARKHEMMVFQVLDPQERDFDYDGPLRLSCLENSQELYCDADTLKKGYQEAFAKQMRLFEAGFNSSNIAYRIFYTDSPWDDALAQFLGRRIKTRL